MASQFKFAPNHDNTAGLLGLHELQPPLFKLYRVDLKCGWRAYAERVRGGDLRFTGLGLPWVEVELPVISAAERQLLRSTFFSSGDLSVPVTIQTLNEDYETYLIYNGWMHWPEDLERDRGHYRTANLLIDQLKHYSAFSSEFNPLEFGV